MIILDMLMFCTLMNNIAFTDNISVSKKTELILIFSYIARQNRTCTCTRAIEKVRGHI